MGPSTGAWERGTPNVKRLLLKTEFRKPWMVIGTTTEGPKILAIFLSDWQIVNAGDASGHEPMPIEFPILVPIGSEPVSAIIVPFVREPNGDPILTKSPNLLNKPVFEFFSPLSREELDDRFAPGQKLRAIAPYAVAGVGTRHFVWITTVPRVFRESHFFHRGVLVERRNWRAVIAIRCLRSR
jgi:hypothetical protein